jgi:hypothetical protein
MPIRFVPLAGLWYSQTMTKHNALLTEAAHSKKTAEEAMQFASFFCDHTQWHVSPSSEMLTVLGAEVVRLRELVQRARDMIDVSPDSPAWEWPTAGEIDQFVKDCDAVLFGAKNHEQPHHDQ